MHKILEKCGLLIVIGTSGNVLDVSFLTQYADFAILNNLEPSDAIIEEVFDQIYYDTVTNAIDNIEKDIRHFIENGTI